MSRMSTHSYEELALEEGVKQYFRRKLIIKEVLLHDTPVSHTMTATVFLSEKNQLYVYIAGEARATFGDVKKIIRRMGFVADAYLPPHGEKDYFERIAKTHFKKVFPGRTTVHESDLYYYETLAHYSPALVQIGEVQKGVIYQYDTDSSSRWRPALNYSYRRIKTI